jgi:hypothetical protein
LTKGIILGIGKPHPKGSPECNPVENWIKTKANPYKYRRNTDAQRRILIEEAHLPNEYNYL